MTLLNIFDSQLEPMVLKTERAARVPYFSTIIEYFHIYNDVTCKRLSAALLLVNKDDLRHILNHQADRTLCSNTGSILTDNYWFRKWGRVYFLRQKASKKRKIHPKKSKVPLDVNGKNLYSCFLYAMLNWKAIT